MGRRTKPRVSWMPPRDRRWTQGPSLVDPRASRALETLSRESRTVSDGVPLQRRRNERSSRDDRDLPAWKSRVTREDRDLPTWESKVTREDRDLPTWNRDPLKRDRDLPTWNRDLPAWNRRPVKRDRDLPAWKSTSKRGAGARRGGNRDLPMWKHDSQPRGPARSRETRDPLGEAADGDVVDHGEWHPISASSGKHPAGHAAASETCGKRTATGFQSKRCHRRGHNPRRLRQRRT
jgi:hypothetical protein